MDFVIGQSYQDVVLADSPVGYWRLGEASGLLAKDIGSGGNDGKYGNSPNLGVSGALIVSNDTAVNFSPANSVVDIPHSSLLTFQGDFTLEAWIKFGSKSVFKVILSKLGTTNPNPGYSFGINSNGALSLETRNSSSGGWSDDSGYDLSNNAWHHVAVTLSGTTAQFYADGAPKGTATRLVPGANTNHLLINADSYLYPTLTYFFSEYIEEAAVYSYALTQTQISRHYNAGIGTYGGTCTSTTGFSEATWNFIGGLFDGSTASFFVNGRQECSISSVPQKLSSASTNLTVGATSSGVKGWVGYLADLVLYGTSDGSTVGTAANIKTNFDATADRYRVNPVGNIVTNGLVLNLDAANAKQGLRPYSNGCASSNLSWFDLSSSALTGTLTGFTSCGTYGWKGSGTSSNPFTVVFDGAADYINTGLNMNLAQNFTWMAWVKIVDNSNYNSLMGQGDGSGTGFYISVMPTANNTVFQTVGASGRWSSSSTSLQLGQWYHLAVVRSANGAANVKMYINSKYDVGIAGVGQAETFTPSDSSSTLEIGRTNYSGTFYYQGASKSISVIQLYNRALSLSEIQQNCNALKSRFSGAICN